MSHRIAVITPYFDEPLAYLEQCHRGVIAQGVNADHLMVADGQPRDCIDGWNARHVKLAAPHGDFGNTPRGIGSQIASKEGYDFIAYLDADNWYHVGHLKSLLQLWEQSRSAVCCSFRTFHDADGDDLGTYEEEEVKLLHVDTSCFLIHRSGFDCLPVWLTMPKPLACIGDRVLLAAFLHRKLTIASTRARTVAYRTMASAHYRLAGRPVPEGARDIDHKAVALAYLSSEEGAASCVRALGFTPLSYISL